eukprot:3318875-Prymnesium_polylepis.1
MLSNTTSERMPLNSTKSQPHSAHPAHMRVMAACRSAGLGERDIPHMLRCNRACRRVTSQHK